MEGARSGVEIYVYGERACSNSLCIVRGNRRMYIPAWPRDGWREREREREKKKKERENYFWITQICLEAQSWMGRGSRCGWAWEGTGWKVSLGGIGFCKDSWLVERHSK